MFKKSAKSEMVTGRLVDSYKKPLLNGIFMSSTLGKSNFYFPHMKYGKFWFHLQFFLNCNFSCLGLFIPKNLMR
jgi:hypothetical protein